MKVGGGSGGVKLFIFSKVYNNYIFILINNNKKVSRQNLTLNTITGKCIFFL